MKPERVYVDQIPLDVFNRDRLLARYTECLNAGVDSMFVGFYAALLRKAATDAQYADDLRSADAVYADGAGAVLALKILSSGREVERLATTDIWRDLISIGADSGRTFAVVASRDDALTRLCSVISEIGGQVVFARNGYIETRDELEHTARDLRASGASIVFVGMGAGVQERFVRQTIDEFPEKGSSQVFFTVGGLADHVAGHTKRAPVVIQRLGLEWAWRMVQEPRRLTRRYVEGNAYFLYRLAKQVPVRRAGGG